MSDHKCHYCDEPAVVSADIVADPEDILYTTELCPYHWRYMQLKHARLMHSILNAEAIDGSGRSVTTPNWRDYENLPYIEEIWPERRSTNHP